MLPNNANKVCDILELKTGEMHRKATMWLYEALTDPDFGPTYNATRSPLMYALGKEGYSGTLYEYLNTQVSYTSILSWLFTHTYVLHSRASWRYGTGSHFLSDSCADTP